jgi:hypothetical protein
VIEIPPALDNPPFITTLRKEEMEGDEIPNLFKGGTGVMVEISNTKQGISNIEGNTKVQSPESEV